MPSHTDAQVLGEFSFFCGISIYPQIWPPHLDEFVATKTVRCQCSMVTNLEAFWMKESLDQCRLLFLTVTTLFIEDKLFRLILAWD